MTGQNVFGRAELITEYNRAC